MIREVTRGSWDKECDGGTERGIALLHDAHYAMARTHSHSRNWREKATQKKKKNTINYASCPTPRSSRSVRSLPELVPIWAHLALLRCAAAELR